MTRKNAAPYSLALLVLARPPLHSAKVRPAPKPGSPPMAPVPRLLDAARPAQRDYHAMDDGSRAAVDQPGAMRCRAIGTLPTKPVIQFNGTPANVVYAAVISPGLYQINLTVPSNVRRDVPVTISYNGTNGPTGNFITVGIYIFLF